MAGFVARESFWATESEAPLLIRNCGFLRPGECGDAIKRASTWPELCQAELGRELEEPKQIETLERIFAADAERTFIAPEFRSEMVTLLRRVGRQTGDYHQGIGYVLSFLSLLLDTDTVYQIMLRLLQPKYMEGYCRGTPETYVRDAQVFQRLMESHVPEVGNKLKNSGVVPEAYASKFFVGLCIHVLPFESLIEFIETFLERGSIFLFQFSLALAKAVAPRVAATKDVSALFSIMRLDPTVFPNSDLGFFSELVAAAKASELEEAEVEALRKEEWEKLQERLERVRAREKAMAEESSDSEIVFSDEEEEEAKDDE